MGNLARRTNHAVAHPSGSSAASSPSGPSERSTASVTYGGKVIMWEDLKEVLPPDSHTGINIGSAVENKKGAFKTPQKTFVQKRIAWRATPNALTVFTLHRALVQVAKGKFKPQGGWTVAETDVFTFASSPSLRKGDVPFTQSTDSKQDSGSAKDKGADSKVDVTLALLPSVVQSYVLNLVKTPIYEHGVNWQYVDDNDLPSKQTLEYMRVDGDNAVIITAERELTGWMLDNPDEQVRVEALAETVWTVSQTAGKVQRVNNVRRLNS